MARLVTLVAACGAFWVLTSVPVRFLTGGELTLLYSGTAMLLCLVPGLVTLAWATYALRHNPHEGAVVALGATGLRLFPVLLVALVLYRNVPLFQVEGGFLIWLLVCYLFTLAVEMFLLLQARPRTDSPA